MDFLEMTLSHRTQFLLGVGTTIVSVILLAMFLNQRSKLREKKGELPLK